MDTKDIDVKWVVVAAGLVVVVALAFLGVRIADRAIQRAEQEAMEQAKEAEQEAMEQAKEAEQEAMEQAKEAIKRVFALYSEYSGTQNDYYDSKVSWVKVFFFQYYPKIDKEGQRRWLSKMSSIPLDGCPSDFAEAHRNYILAYRNLNNLTVSKWDEENDKWMYTKGDPKRRLWEKIDSIAGKYGVVFEE